MLLHHVGTFVNALTVLAVEHTRVVSPYYYVPVHLQCTILGLRIGMRYSVSAILTANANSVTVLRLNSWTISRQTSYRVVLIAIHIYLNEQIFLRPPS
jgi:hypothetical protein